MPRGMSATRSVGAPDNPIVRDFVPPVPSLLVKCCSDCATVLDEVPPGDPCPGCGGYRRSTVVRVQTAHEVETAMPFIAVTKSQASEVPERITVSSADFRSASEAGFESGRQSFTGRPPQNEEDVLQVCRALRTALAREGLVCGRFRLPSDRVDDVDAVADREDGRLVQVQVTRVERGVWRDLAIEGAAELHRSAAALAGDIVVAIESKLLYPEAQRGRIVLALDALRSPGYTSAAVVQAVLDERADWIAECGFEGVWLVGASAALTYRLDKCGR
jgi:hypothetical protein